MNNKKKLMVAGMLVFALLIAGVGGTIAFAQGPTGSSNTMENLYLSSLAQKLGTTIDKLQQAMTDARKDSATQAVKQGLITQAQADQMLQREFGRDTQASIVNAGLAAAAKSLGMTTTDLTTALQSKTLLTLATEKKVDVTALRTAIADAQKAAIDQAVKDGKLTQAQADTMKSNIKPENIDLNRLNFGGRGGLGNFDGSKGADGRGGSIAPNGNTMPKGGVGAPPTNGKR